MSEPIILDNTKRKTFRQCKKKYFLQHINGLQPDYGSTALRYGVAWHGIQEGYYSYVQNNGWPTTQEEHIAAITAGLELGKKKWDKETAEKKYFDDYRNFNTLVDHFNAYNEFFAGDRDYIKIISTETKFECAILPETKLEESMLENIPPLLFTGKIDLSIVMDYQNWLLDFKTTGWILDKVVMEANRSPQFIGYSYAGDKVLDFKPNGCLVSFAFAGASKSKKTGEYGSTRFEFRRVPQIYTAGDIHEWKLSFIDTASEIYKAINTGLWTESFDNCYQYGACPYLKLCNQHCKYEDLNLEGFHVAFWDVLEED